VRQGPLLSVPPGETPETSHPATASRRYHHARLGAGRDIEEAKLQSIPQTQSNFPRR